MLRIGGAGGHLVMGGVQPRTVKQSVSQPAVQPPVRSAYNIRQLRFAGQQVKVMTYNIEQFDDRTAKAKKQALAKVIQNENPEVLLLQEVGNEAVLRKFVKDYLNNDYPNMAFFTDPYAAARPRGMGMSQAILSKAAYPISDTQNHLNEKNAKGYRCFTRDLGQTTVWIGNFPLTLYNAHFKSMFQGEQSTIVRREEEARTAVKVIAQQSNNNPYFMLAGDLNTKPTSAYGEKTLAILKANPGPIVGWTPIAQNQAFPMVETFELFNQQPIPTNNPNNPHLKPVKLDYMFVSKPLSNQVKQSYASGDLFKDPWRKASDHIPVVSVFEVPDNPLPFTVKKQ